MTVKSSYVHFALAVLWAVLAVPTVLYWRESILWVSLISVYANVVSHWGAYQAARGEEAADRKLDEVKDHITVESQGRKG